MPTRVCTSGSPRAFTSGGLLGHSWGGGRLFHIHCGQQGSPGCSHLGGLGGLGDAAAFRPTAGEISVTAGHTAEGTGIAQAHLENQVVSRCAHLESLHIWRACPDLHFPTQSCAEAADKCTSGLSLSSTLWALHTPPNLPGVRWAMHYSSVPRSRAQRK